MLGTDLILGYGTMENIIGGGMGGPLGPNPNPSKTCEKNILKMYLIFYGYKLCTTKNCSNIKRNQSTIPLHGRVVSCY